MAKKSKTQRARASARRAKRKELQEQEVLAAEDSSSANTTEAPDKKGLFKKAEKPAESQPKASEKKSAKKQEKAKKPGFFSEVRAEMKRVTWPTRQDVIRWSGVVVGALVFFGVYVFILDNWIVTPLLLAISSLGA